MLLQNLPIYNYVNGQYVSAEERVVATNDMGFLRGFGIFDYIQSYEGELFHAQDHIDRLMLSASKVDIKIPLTKEEILEVLEKIIALNPKINAGIRIIVTPGNVSADLISPDLKPNIYVLFHPFRKIDDRFYFQGMKVATTTHLRFFPEVKSTNYMPAVLSLKEAKKIGCDDIVYIDENQDLLEASTSNIFFFKEGMWFTDNSARILQGVTRKLLLQFIIDPANVTFQAIKKHDLKNCQEAFLCSSAKEVMPLVQVDDIPIGNGRPGPHTYAIMKKFQTYIHTQVKSSNLATVFC